MKASTQHHVEVSGQLHILAALHLGKRRGLGESQSQSGLYRAEKHLAATGIRNPAVQPVANRYTIWAIQKQTPNIL
jgi:hypothetical protein